MTTAMKIQEPGTPITDGGWRYSLPAFILVIALNVLARSVGGIHGLTVSFMVALFVAFFALWSFSKTYQRRPWPIEQQRIVAQFSAFVAFTHLGVLLSLFAGGGFAYKTVFTLLVSASIYIFTMKFVLATKSSNTSAA